MLCPSLKSLPSVNSLLGSPIHFRTHSYCLQWSKSALLPWGVGALFFLVMEHPCPTGLSSSVKSVTSSESLRCLRGKTSLPMLRSEKSTALVFPPGRTVRGGCWLQAMITGTLLQACFSAIMNVLNFQMYFKSSTCSPWPKGR